MMPGPGFTEEEGVLVYQKKKRGASGVKSGARDWAEHKGELLVNYKGGPGGMKEVYRQLRWKQKYEDQDHIEDLQQEEKQGLVM